MCGLVAHPARERLIQPRVIPPLRGDQITEPLVREFVRVHCDEPLPAFRGCIVGQQDQVIAINNGRRVLHRAGIDRRCNQVELAVWVLVREIAFEIFHQRAGCCQRQVQVVTLAAGGDGAQRYDSTPNIVRRDRPAGARVERADREREQIRRQWPGRREHDALEPVSDRLLTGHRRVANHRVFVARGDGDVERGLEHGLVEAGKHPPGIQHLELREGVPLTVDLRVIQAFRRRAERRLVFET